jgi:hypothetical protein
MAEATEVAAEAVLSWLAPVDRPERAPPPPTVQSRLVIVLVEEDAVTAPGAPPNPAKSRELETVIRTGAKALCVDRSRGQEL